jgi:hypothetical protein
MALPEPLPEQARRLLATARRSRRAARDAMRELELDAQVALVCETPVARRSALLDLMPEPERVIPELPEAELCFTAKAVGLHDAGWILEHATPEQMVACVDLDAWSEFVPDPEGVDAWIQAFADAGAPTLVTAARELDAELLVLWLRWRVEVALRPQDDDWTPAPGAQTLDQQFYYRARRDGDDLEEVALLLRSLFTEDYWLYFRLMQGVIWEMQSDAEEWAGRWRQGRIQDLGFPPWDEAMRIYGYLRPDRRTEIPSEGRRPVAEWKLPVWPRRLLLRARGPVQQGGRGRSASPWGFRVHPRLHREGRSPREPGPRLRGPGERSRPHRGLAAALARAAVPGRCQSRTGSPRGASRNLGRRLTPSGPRR